MLKLRPEQMAVFQPLADKMFITRLCQHLREDYASETVRLADGNFTVRKLSDDQLQKLAQVGVTRARSHGLEDEASLSAFVALMIGMAPNFDEHPLLLRMLADENTPPPERVTKLLEGATEQNWEAARQSYDVEAWEPKK